MPLDFVIMLSYLFFDQLNVFFLKIVSLTMKTSSRKLEIPHLVRYTFIRNILA